jgi:hypothetical protein
MLYKYLNPSRVDVIENLSIRFSQPSALNDPFEATALIKFSHSLKNESEREFEKIIDEEGIDRNDPEYAVIRDEILSELYSNIEKITHPKRVGDEVMELVESAQGVLSLSRTKESLLMWAHYGDSHKGYVLGLDENHAFFKAPDMRGRPTSPMNVTYTTQRLFVDADRDNYREILLCTKSLEWAYEEEVRVFRTFGSRFSDFEKNTKGQIHLFSIPHDCIREVYFGANCGAQTRERILGAIDRHKLNVKVYSAHLLFEKYALGFTEISSPEIFSYRMREFYKESERSFNHFAYAGHV